MIGRKMGEEMMKLAVSAATVVDLEVVVTIAL